ncbi:MAG: lipid-A-disaccharide synthase [Deltaproteobacteria bacterium]|nr:lipid-A-disaccharide synthase [Deltaproteobacteria bacterium]MBW2444762.1 lipid-A-disaccharide synthase [Deltaproteobacteria bacterium]
MAAARVVDPAAPVTTVMISTGDASGDIHAAALVRALRQRIPDARFLGLGGVEMEKEGVEIVVHQREVAVAGLLEVAGALPKIFGAWRALGRAARELRPDLAILIDTPDFNLPLARRLKRAGVPVLYFIGPQVWAWRQKRVFKIARRVDRLAVIFPFEVDFYRPTGLQVDFVGHPLVERMKHAATLHERAADRRSLGLDPETPVLALLPGSRRNEIENMLPLFLETASVVHARNPRVAFVLPVASTLSREWLDEKIAAAKLPSMLRLEVLEGKTYEAISACDAALAMPGTVNLEVALLDRPQVAAVRVNPLTYRIAMQLLRVPWVTLPNLIAQGPVIPEFLQDDAEPEQLADALLGLVSGPARDAQLEALVQVRARLGPGGAAERTADIACEMIRGNGA